MVSTDISIQLVPEVKAKAAQHTALLAKHKWVSLSLDSDQGNIRLTLHGSDGRDTAVKIIEALQSAVIEFDELPDE